MNLVPLGQGTGPHAPPDRQRQGSSRPLPQSDDAKGICRTMGPKPVDGDELCRRFEGQLRASRCRQRHGLQGEARGMSRGLDYHGDVLKIGEIYDIDELRALGGVVDYVVGTPLTKVYCLAEHPDAKQRTISTCTRWARARSILRALSSLHFEVPTAIARTCLFRDPAPDPRRVPWWRCVPSPSAISKRERCSTTMACT